MQSTFDDRINEVARFSVMTFLWSWLWWTPRILATYGVISLSPLWDVVLGAIGALGPGLTALTQVWRTKGKTAAIEFCGRGWKFNFNPMLLLPAVVIMPLIGGLTTWVLALTGLENPWEYSLLSIIDLPLVFVIVVLLISAAGEETGWRGFVQQQLQTILNPFRASLVLGLVWGVWQLPLHFIGGTLQSVLPVMQIILQAIALSVLFTWLYNKSRGSLLVATLFHFSVSLCGLIFPVWASTIGQWVYLLLIIVSIVGLGMAVGLYNYRKNQV